MKFVDFLILKENLKPSIDDNSVLTKLNDLNIVYDRIKNEDGNFLYSFDNRFSLIYDGSLFVLYRHENVIHRANARNQKEIDDILTTWNDSYQFDNQELSDADIDNLIDKIKNDSGNDEMDYVADNDSEEEEDETNNEDDYNEDDSKTDQENEEEDDKK